MKEKFQVYVVKAIMWIARILFSCFVSYAVYKVKQNEKGELNMANPIWSALGQIALATAASYGSAKLADSQTEWKPFRDQLLQQLTSTALTVAIAQVSHAAGEKVKNPTQKALIDMVIAQTQGIANNPQPLIDEAGKLIDRVTGKKKDQ